MYMLLNGLFVCLAGFPKWVEDVVLKGAEKRMIRAGIQLTPVDFAANIAALSKQFNVVSSLLRYVE